MKKSSYGMKSYGQLSLPRGSRSLDLLSLFQAKCTFMENDLARKRTISLLVFKLSTAIFNTTDGHKDSTNLRVRGSMFITSSDRIPGPDLDIRYSVSYAYYFVKQAYSGPVFHLLTLGRCLD